MEEDSKHLLAGEAAADINGEAAEADEEGEGEGEGEGRDPESNLMTQPLLKRHRTLSSSPLALVGAKVSHIESLDYECVPSRTLFCPLVLFSVCYCWTMNIRTCRVLVPPVLQDKRERSVQA